MRLKDCRASAPLADAMAGDAACPTNYFALFASLRWITNKVTSAETAQMIAPKARAKAVPRK
jgi:hypothetical protein